MFPIYRPFFFAIEQNLDWQKNGNYKLAQKFWANL